MDDKELIQSLGGVGKVAAMLGFSVQRVQNWVGRGSIPSAVKISRPDLFLGMLPKKINESGKL